jgi:hypothetical protein
MVEAVVTVNDVMEAVCDTDHKVRHTLDADKVVMDGTEVMEI